jgi:predicted small lipoprotein YifL
VKVDRPIDRWRGLALAAIILTALGLAACGRKGNLDPPPNAALPASPQSNAPRASLGEDTEAPVPANGERPSSRRQAAAASPPPTASPQNKSFFLDFLLGK